MSRILIVKSANLNDKSEKRSKRIEEIPPNNAWLAVFRRIRECMALRSTGREMRTERQHNGFVDNPVVTSMFSLTLMFDEPLDN